MATYLIVESISTGIQKKSNITNVLDIACLIAYLYRGGPAPPRIYEGDANGDCTINIPDITYLTAHLNPKGPEPVRAENYPG